MNFLCALRPTDGLVCASDFREGNATANKNARKRPAERDFRCCSVFLTLVKIVFNCRRIYISKSVCLVSSNEAVY